MNSNDELFHRIEACPLCGSGSHRVVRTEANNFPQDDPFYDPYRREPVRLRRCRDCQFACVEEWPANPEFYRHLYGFCYRWEDELRNHGKGPIFRQARRCILEHKSGGTLLDVGAAMGSFMLFMSDCFQVSGVEIHPGPVEYGRSQGLDIRCGAFMDTEFPVESFDVISFIDVLEHLPKPAEVLAKARRLLKPGGLIFIKVPNYRAQIAKQDFLNRTRLSPLGIMANYAHINHFSPEVLARHLEGHGFRVLKAGFTPSLIHPPMKRLPSFQRLRNAGENLVRRSVTALMNALANLTGLPTGFNLFVLARKSG